MISVIVPIYNVEKYLEKCIQSIQSQTYRDIEIILVDDGSPDDCGRICDKYKEGDSRIKVIHKLNGGLSDARNAGIEVASGDFISFIDSDDYIHPQMLEILYHNLISAKTDISVCAFREVSENEEIAINQISEPVQTETFADEQVMNQLYERNLITVVAWNKLYRREIFAHNRYCKGKIHEDEFLIHHLLHACKRIVYTKQPLYFYVQRKSSITGAVKWNQVSDGWQAYKERLQFLKDNSYEQMHIWTKLHMLHYIVVYYEKLTSVAQAEALLQEWRNAFKALYKERVVKDNMSKQLLQEYKYFVISPRLYYNRKESKQKWDKRIQKCKLFVKRLIMK